MKQLIKSFLFILAFAIAGDDWTDNKKAIDKSVKKHQKELIKIRSV